MTKLHLFLAILAQSISWIGSAPLASSHSTAAHYGSLNLTTVTDQPAYLSLFKPNRSNDQVPHFALVLYHRLDCPRCRAFMPIFESWVATLPPDLPPGLDTLYTLGMGSIDCGNPPIAAAEPSKGACQGIEPVPTARLFKNGVYIATLPAQSLHANGLSRFLFPSLAQRQPASDESSDCRQHHASLLQLLLFMPPQAAGAPLLARSGSDAAALSPINLTRANFSSSTSSEAWLVKFFAPWCSHCRALAPTWEALASVSRSNGLYDRGIRIGSVDCTTDEQLCKEMQVQGYPTIKYCVNGSEWKECLSERALDSYVKFIQDNMLASADDKGLARWITRAEFVKEKSRAGPTKEEEGSGLAALFVYLFDPRASNELEDSLVVEAASAFQFEKNRAGLYLSDDRSILDHLGANQQRELPVMIFAEPESALVESLSLSPQTSPDFFSVWIHDRLFPGLSFLSARNARPLLGLSDRLILLFIMDKRRPEASQYYEQLHIAALQFQAQPYASDEDYYCRLKFVAVDRIDFAAYIHRVYGEKDQGSIRAILIDPKSQVYYDDIDLIEYSNKPGQSGSLIRKEGLDAIVRAYQSQGLASPATRVHGPDSTWLSEDSSVSKGLIGFLLLVVLVLLFGLMGIRWSRRQYHLIPSSLSEEKPRKE